MGFNTKDFPFGHALSFRPLIEHLGKLAAQGQIGIFKELQKKLDEAPELMEPVVKLEVLEKYSSLVRELMVLVFPQAFWETEAVAALVPLRPQPFLSSPLFERLFLQGDGSLIQPSNMDEEDFLRGRILRAFLIILDRFYGIKKPLDFPIIRRVVDPGTSLERYFKMNVNFSFIHGIARGGIKPLSAEQHRLVLENLTNPAVLREVIPPQNFELRGFTVVQAVEVTQSEVLLSVESDLIGQESFLSRNGFAKLQKRLRTFFWQADLVSGIVAFHNDHVLVLNTSCCMERNCIFADSQHVPLDMIKGSVYERAVREDRVITIADLKEVSQRTILEENLLRNGVRSLMVAPLKYQNEHIGTLDIGSPRPNALGPMEEFRFKQLLPIFSMALKRALEELENRIEALIKEKCTAVHPAVEWRFRKAALRHLQRLRDGQRSDFEPIVFRDVYPLFGSSDIRGSAELRAKSIQEDLIEHLSLALGVVDEALKVKSLPILEELRYRILQNLRHIKEGIRSGDEINVVGFLKKEVEPFFQFFRGLGPKVSRAVDHYESSMDPRSGSVYKRRMAFEESVSMLNDHVASYLEKEEQEAQSILPHYFEKHQTDGVDYLIYVGQSLLESGSFNQLYLENFHLWQLMVTCGMAWLAQQLRGSLPLPLDMAHLILVNNSPLSIRFRFDEKRFDLEGTYDIRHEIIRSRIDKAVVKGTGERLTQPGKISIVYTRPQEARSIRRHLEFLSVNGYLAGDVEALELDALPGVHGLKAFRVDVNMDSHALQDRIERLAS